MANRRPGSQRAIQFRLKAEFARAYPELDAYAVHVGHPDPWRPDFLKVIMRSARGVARQLGVWRAHVDEIGSTPTSETARLT
jgi:hypothetical protein